MTAPGRTWCARYRNDEGNNKYCSLEVDPREWHLVFHDGTDKITRGMRQMSGPCPDWESCPPTRVEATGLERARSGDAKEGVTVRKPPVRKSEWDGPCQATIEEEDTFYDSCRYDGTDEVPDYQVVMTQLQDQDDGPDFCTPVPVGEATKYRCVSPYWRWNNDRRVVCTTAGQGTTVQWVET